MTYQRERARAMGSEPGRCFEMSTERAFVVVEQQGGLACIAFEGLSSPGRNLVDIVGLDD